MRYIPNSPAERESLLAAVGAASIDDLFATVPRAVYRKEPPGLPPPASEIEVRRDMGRMAAKNAHLGDWTSFLGAGLYSHHAPAFVSQLLLRGEFLTSYTPYQPEVSQGTLTAIYEFQTHMALLTGMDVANASMYEGASAFVEAVLMAERLTKKKTKVVVSAGLHPEYRQCLRTYLVNFPFTIVEVPLAADGTTDAGALAAAVDDATFAVSVQSPNVFGVVESWKVAADAAHAHGALAIGVVNEMFSLAVLEAPGASEIDIACGEAASFGLAPSFGGPLVGFLACRDAFKRQIPGRLAGRTTDADGKPGFCLTLSTREQHIRREKATSNICTNQALIALMATVFMTVYGKQGLRELAEQNLAKAHYLAGKWKPRFSGNFFNEFVVRAEGKSPGEINKALLKKKIVGGLPLGRFYPELADSMLLCATEMTKRADMDALVEVLA